MALDDDGAVWHKAGDGQPMTEGELCREITPLILTFNEGPNLGRTLETLAWARRVIVVDSNSTDETLEIARSYPNVVLVQRCFDNHTSQWNYGVDLVDTAWVLSLDADYIVTKEFCSELANLSFRNDVSAYSARFRYCVFGRLLRGSLYPPRAVLFRKDRCRYVQRGHTQVLAVEGPTEMLKHEILHDDRKPLGRWVTSQMNYARLEAEKLMAASPAELSRADRLRLRIWPAAPAALLYTLLVKGCLFDGWPGWYYALQRCFFETLLSLELLDRRLRKHVSAKPE